MKLRVGSSQNGSGNAVRRSGTMTMSPELMPLKPDRRTVKTDPVRHQFVAEARRGIVTWCQRPHRSQNLRSTCSMPSSAMYRSASSTLSNISPPSTVHLSTRWRAANAHVTKFTSNPSPRHGLCRLARPSLFVAIETPGPMGGHCLDMRQQALPDPTSHPVSAKNLHLIEKHSLQAQSHT